MRKTANPLLQLRSQLRGAGPRPTDPGAATVRGTVHDSAVLAGLVVLSFAYPLQRAEWQPFSPEIFVALGAGVSLIYGAVMHVRRSAAALVASIYSMGIGLVLGGMCAYLEREVAGIWSLIAVAPLAVFLVMLWLYGIVLVSPSRRWLMIVHGVVGGLFLTFLFSVVRHTAHNRLPTMVDAPVAQIAIVIAVVLLAAFCFQLDFSTIDRGLKVGAPRRFQWFCAVGLVTTQIWMFPELVNIATHLHVRVRDADDDDELTPGEATPASTTTGGNGNGPPPA
ncbi:MAG: Bax inhibitor-1/YccA family protein [Thermoleophilia bacterium]|nr:Bax inhibitor-1/YccA family protein [Thermoleophilia bacterium]